MKKKKVMNATFWSFIVIVGRQSVVFIVGIILARILDPEQFGLVAMIVVFSSFGQVFLNFGFGKALIQDRNVTQHDLSTIYFALGPKFTGYAPPTNKVWTTKIQIG